MDRGTWWATVHKVARSQTQLKRLSTHHSSWTLPFPQASACLLLPVTANSFLIHCRFICSGELSYCPYRWPHSTWHYEFVGLHFILLGPDCISGVLQSMGSQRVGHNWATQLTDWLTIFLIETKGFLSFFLPFSPSSSSSSSSFSSSSLHYIFS